MSLTEKFAFAVEILEDIAKIVPEQYDIEDIQLMANYALEAICE